MLTYKKPNAGKTYPVQTPAESDEFNSAGLGLQWQWMANPKATWFFMNPSKGLLRLYSDKAIEGTKNLWGASNVLLQKFPTEEFMVTTKISFTPNTKIENEKAGLTVMGFSYANIALKSRKDGIYLLYTICKDADNGKEEVEKQLMKAGSSTVYFRVKVTAGALCRFSYSFNGQTFTDAGEPFKAETGRWTGAKVGLFCTRDTQINDSGYADVDWFRVEKVE